MPCFGVPYPRQVVAAARRRRTCLLTLLICGQHRQVEELRLIGKRLQLVIECHEACLAVVLTVANVRIVCGLAAGGARVSHADAPRGSGCVVRARDPPSSTLKRKRASKRKAHAVLSVVLSARCRGFRSCLCHGFSGLVYDTMCYNVCVSCSSTPTLRLHLYGPSRFSRPYAPTSSPEGRRWPPAAAQFPHRATPGVFLQIL